jgi:hypothetical protein
MKIIKTDGSILIDMPKLESIKKMVKYCLANKADLSEADLSGADLSGADLSGAYLSEANLCRADLSGAKNIFTFNKLNGRICYAVVFGADLYIKAGCFWGKLDEFILAVKRKYSTDNTENYSAQIKYLIAIKNSLNRLDQNYKANIGW